MSCTDSHVGQMECKEAVARTPPSYTCGMHAQVVRKLRTGLERAGAEAAALPVGPAPGGGEAALDAGEARRLVDALQALLDFKAAGNRRACFPPFRGLLLGCRAA